MAKLYRFLRFQERQTEEKCCWQLPEIPVYANEPGISANELSFRKITTISAIPAAFTPYSLRALQNLLFRQQHCFEKYRSDPGPLRYCRAQGSLPPYHVPPRPVNSKGPGHRVSASPGSRDRARFTNSNQTAVQLIQIKSDLQFDPQNHRSN